MKEGKFSGDNKTQGYWSAPTDVERLAVAIRKQLTPEESTTKGDVMTEGLRYTRLSIARGNVIGVSVFLVKH